LGVLVYLGKRQEFKKPRILRGFLCLVRDRAPSVLRCALHRGHAVWPDKPEEASTVTQSRLIPLAKTATTKRIC
jgi:hypothetical protein